MPLIKEKCGTNTIFPNIPDGMKMDFFTLFVVFEITEMCLYKQMLRNLCTA
uniref:Uncharacterized protein n=1 Tax=Arion vulgaris TaxID=1028688 RepID=A0A0B7AQT7_9EUPU